jgi:hypothetical protein
MSPKTPTASPIKCCPVCGVAMLGRRKTPMSRDFDYFECFNCDLIIDYSGPKNPDAALPNE